MTIGTEHGFALTLGTQGDTLLIMNIGGHQESVDVVEKHHHGTTGNKRYMPGDLTALNQFELEIQFDGEDGLPDLKVEETITITHPLASGESVAAQIAGEGFIVSREWPGGAAGGTGLKRGKLTIQWTGDTGPTFTAATTGT
jgi:hypothetical protein